MHTPGPWKSDGKVIGWLSGDQPAVRVTYEQPNRPGFFSPVCMVEVDGAGKYGSAGSLNPIDDARLIAAAPDLLAALKAVEWKGTGYDREGDKEKRCPCCNESAPGYGGLGEHTIDCQLASAIAKAEGSQ